MAHPTPGLLYRFSVTSAQWDAVRLLVDSGKGTTAEDERLAEVTRVLGDFSEQIGLGGNPSRIICKSWQEAAEDW